MRVKANLFIGMACIVLGVTMSLASERTIYYGLVVYGIYRIFRGADAARPPSRNKIEPPPSNDPRWSQSSEPQVVGKPCDACEKRFVTADDAESCETCGAWVHAACRTAHRTAKHAVHAYR